MVSGARRVLARRLRSCCMLGGGAAGLVDYAMQQQRQDPHAMAHLGAMYATIWALRSYLDSAGHEIDLPPHNREVAMQRALTVRLLVEQACTDVLRRLPRACMGRTHFALDEMYLAGIRS